MLILAASGCNIEEDIDYGGNDMTYCEVKSVQKCANFARQSADKGTMGTLGWVFYPDNGHCRPQQTLVGNSRSGAVSGTVECGGKFNVSYVLEEGLNANLDVFF